MSGREWKPGDVAMVRNEYGVWNRAICSVKPIGIVWQYGVSDSLAAINAEARPLVVIDAEDREQVERLWDQVALQARANPIGGGSLDDLQAALREFANPTPPRPEEPTGLGAVVEDAEGERWVRKGNSSHGEDWTRQIGDAWTGGSWDRIAAVRVLSSGVQP